MNNKQVSSESKESNTKHRWYDVIVAWASGEKIQYKLPASKEWTTYNQHTYISTGFESSQPDFSDRDYEWRIKPRTVTRRYRMALVHDYGVVSVDITNSSLDDPIEYNIQGFIRWVGDTVEVEIELCV